MWWKIYVYYDSIIPIALVILTSACPKLAFSDNPGAHNLITNLRAFPSDPKPPVFYHPCHPEVFGGGELVAGPTNVQRETRQIQHVALSGWPIGQIVHSG